MWQRFRKPGSYDLPAICLLVSLLPIIPIMLFSCESNRANYLSAYASFLAAAVAVFLAIWLEWKKDQAQEREEKIHARVGASKLLPIANQLLKDILWTRGLLNGPMSHNRLGDVMVQNADRPLSEASRMFSGMADTFDELAPKAAEPAAILFGQLAMYRGMVEHLQRLARSEEWKTRDEDLLATDFDLHLSDMETIAKRLVYALSNDLSRNQL